MSRTKIRLCVDHPLGAGQTVPLTREQAHYLFGVMRLGPGACILLFNGRDGEFEAEVTQAGKRGGELLCNAQTRPLRTPPDLWLLFAPIKKARTDFIVEKAVEMGVARILPIQTEFTNSERIRQDRLQAHAKEASEQCGATFVPPVEEMQKLDRLLSVWPKGRRLLFCDELNSGGRFDLRNAKAGPWAILIGPEGGFSDAERNLLGKLPEIAQIGLGPRILRADTAVVVALTLWQSALGDW